MSSVASDKIRILLADDHTVVRESMRDILNLQPDMEVAGEARTAIQKERQGNLLGWLEDQFQAGLTAQQIGA